MSTETDSILDVHGLFRDGGDWCCKCPHCKQVIGLQGDTIEDVQGEQFRCRCKGWLQVSSRARRVLPPPTPQAT